MRVNDQGLFEIDLSSHHRDGSDNGNARMVVRHTYRRDTFAPSVDIPSRELERCLGAYHVHSLLHFGRDSAHCLDELHVDVGPAFVLGSIPSDVCLIENAHLFIRQCERVNQNLKKDVSILGAISASRVPHPLAMLTPRLFERYSDHFAQRADGLERQITGGDRD